MDCRGLRPSVHFLTEAVQELLVHCRPRGKALPSGRGLWCFCVCVCEEVSSIFFLVLCAVLGSNFMTAATVFCIDLKLLAAAPPKERSLLVRAGF